MTPNRIIQEYSEQVRRKQNVIEWLVERVRLLQSERDRLTMEVIKLRREAREAQKFNKGVL